MDEQRDRLVHSRHFCTDRLVEVKDELGRLQDEGLELKVKLAHANDIEAGTIRRRRRFLSRRLDELKVERAALANELQEATDKLKKLEASVD